MISNKSEGASTLFYTASLSLVDGLAQATTSHSGASSLVLVDDCWAEAAAYLSKAVAIKKKIKIIVIKAHYFLTCMLAGSAPSI